MCKCYPFFLARQQSDAIRKTHTHLDLKSPRSGLALSRLLHNYKFAKSLLTTPQNSVTIFSAVRLFCLATSRAGTYPVFDPSWYAPPIFIFSSLEIEMA